MMNVTIFFTAILTAILYLFHFPTIASTKEHECSVESDSTNKISLFLNSKRNYTGEWVTNFFLRKDDTNFTATNDITLDLSQDLQECSDRRSLHIKGILTGALKTVETKIFEDRRENIEGKIRFDTQCGSNVAVLNNGRTIQRIDSEKDGNAVTFTQRPLKSNEILEITLERKHTKFTHSLGIGLSTQPANTVSSSLHINNIINTSWALYDGKFFHNGKQILENYGKNVNSLSVGERVGVMRSSTGSLHYFVNGVDQGPAASNVPSPVYGVVEPRGHALMVTIVDN